MPVIGIDPLSGLTLNANWSRLFKVSQNENEAKAYVINWAGELDEDAISTSDWTTEDSITIANEESSTIETSARLSAASPGCYRAVNTITTSNGDTLERIIEVRVGENNPGSLLDYV
jgi:adenine specific DNA methylase Mod